MEHVTQAKPGNAFPRPVSVMLRGYVTKAGPTRGLSELARNAEVMLFFLDKKEEAREPGRLVTSF